MKKEFFKIEMQDNHAEPDDTRMQERRDYWQDYQMHQLEIAHPLEVEPLPHRLRLQLWLQRFFGRFGKP